MEFQLISANELFKLNSMVNDMLFQGWELYGDPQVSIGASPTSSKVVHKIYAQAVIKKTTHLEDNQKQETTKTEDEDINGEEWQPATVGKCDAEEVASRTEPDPTAVPKSEEKQKVEPQPEMQTNPRFEEPVEEEEETYIEEPQPEEKQKVEPATEQA